MSVTATTPEYIRLLSIDERAAAMKLGASIKLAQHCGLSKQAAISLTADGAMKTVALVSLVGGIPLGVAAHLVGQKLSKDSQRQKELKEKIKYYREATRTLGSGLPGQ